jgi:phosphoglycolate phosphatase-like HAD superfamily hydrolase
LTNISRSTPISTSSISTSQDVVVAKPKKVADREIEPTPQLRLVFDFDGVIADSGDALYDSLNAVAVQNKRPPFAREDLSDMSTKELINKLGLRWYSLLYWVPKVLKELKARRQGVPVAQDIKPVLEWATKENVDTVIVSSNNPGFIKTFLAEHLPECKFSKIVGDVAVFGKARAIKRLCNRNYRMLYIGDEARDVVAAKKAGVQSVAVCWGKDSGRVLSNAEPSYQVNTGDELLNVARELRRSALFGE